jgi:hypothetical protein
LRHTISPAEAATIQKARSVDVNGVDSITLERLASTGNVAAIARLTELRDNDAAELRAGTQ